MPPAGAGRGGRGGRGRSGTADAAVAGAGGPLRRDDLQARRRGGLSGARSDERDPQGLDRRSGGW